MIVSPISTSSQGLVEALSLLIDLLFHLDSPLDVVFASYGSFENGVWIWTTALCLATVDIDLRSN